MKLTREQAGRLANDIAERAVERLEQIAEGAFSDEEWENTHDFLADEFEHALHVVRFPSGAKA